MAAKNWRGTAALILALVAGLGVNEALFRIAAKYQAQVAEVALEDLLDRDDLLVDPHLLAQAVSNLESLHLIRCTSMSSQRRPELVEFVNMAQSESCSHRTISWLTPNLPVQRTIHAGNGEEIEASYQVILGNGFAIGLWGSRFLWIVLILVFWYAIRTRFEHQRMVLELEGAHAKAASEIAEQVSHDLVSPLATLNELLIEAQQAQIPEGLRYKLRNGIGKIRDIINELKSRPSKRTSNPISSGELQKRSPELLSAIVDSLVSEKCTEFRSKVGVQLLFHFNPEDFGLFSVVNALKLQRVLSNLINNAVQALNDGTGQVDVHLSKRGEGSVQIEIKDNGIGIPSEIRSKLGMRGQTFGRPAGSGLGLFDAKTTIENWAGEFVIDSSEGEGTSVKLILPKAPSPRWFLDSISLRPAQRVVIIDDDSGIHGIWKRRIEEAVPSGDLELIHFHSASSFKSWYASARKDSKHTLFLFDYELLGESENGLDLIESFSLADQSALVTSRYDTSLIRERSNRLAVRILPKTMTPLVPIIYGTPQSERPDVVLIDDDATVLLMWSKAAKRNGKVIKSFSNARSFLDCEWIFDRATPIFVDVDLGEDSGEELAKKLSKLGFQELHLATGYETSRFDLDASPWIKSVQGKMPPWES
jgi:signal transduction histidine kinase